MKTKWMLLVAAGTSGCMLTAGAARVADFINGSIEHSLKKPNADVTGSIDLTNGTLSMHVVTAQTIHFEAGCFIVCVIDEDDDGTMTTDVTGTIVFPDTDHDGVPDRS